MAKRHWLLILSNVNKYYMPVLLLLLRWQISHGLKERYETTAITITATIFPERRRISTLRPTSARAVLPTIKSTRGLFTGPFHFTSRCERLLLLLVRS